MRSKIISLVALAILVGTAMFVNAGPIKGLVDIGTGVEVPDADARYFQQSELTNTAAGSEGFRKIGALGGYNLEHFTEETAIKGLSRDLPTWTFTEGFLPFPSLVVSWSGGDVFPRGRLF